MTKEHGPITRAELASQLESNRGSIGRLIKAGLPIRKDGRFDRHIALEWIVRQTSGARGGWGAARGKEDIRARAEHLLHGVLPSVQQDHIALSKNDLDKKVLTERHEKLRLENAARRGELVEAVDVEHFQFQRASAERDALLNWPAQISAGLAAKLGLVDRELFIELDAEVRKFLEARSRQPVMEMPA